jgi:ATP synthase protein I
MTTPMENKNENRFSRQIAEKEKRKLDALQKKNPTVWMGLGMFGMVGWSIAVPTILGAILGVWLDKTYTQSFSWTLSLMMTGLVVGAVIGWLWVSKEEKEMNKKTEYDE